MQSSNTALDTRSDGGIYQPVEPRHAFRILLLQPAAELEDDIICDLLHASLDEVPPYEALSYVWGESTSPGTVYLEGQGTPVTPNLESALRYLRRPDSVR